MSEVRRGPGRPSYDSKQKLLAAACALLAERGFEATSPQMIQQRSGVGHGSMYHHFRGKEDVALNTISHMRGQSITFLEGQLHQGAQSDPATVSARVEEALEHLFTRREGQALIRLLADSVVGAIKPLAATIEDWLNDIQVGIIIALRNDQPSDDPEIADAAARFLAPEFQTRADELLIAALGRGLLGLSRPASPIRIE